MLIVSASMPRSGSLFYVFLLRALFQKAGIHNTGTKVLMEELNIKLRLPDRLETWRLLNLAKKVGDKRTAMIKVHAGPTIALRYLMTRNYLRATYVYRDPRDVIVSALELGEKLRETSEPRRYFGIGPYRSFARLQTLEGAIRWVKWQLYPRWKQWIRCKNVHIARYEDVVTDTFTELKLLSDFFNLDVSDTDLEDIVSVYSSSEGDEISKWRDGRGPVKNKGVIGRYKTALTQQQQNLCKKRLGKCLKEMGYF